MAVNALAAKVPMVAPSLVSLTTTFVPETESWAVSLAVKLTVSVLATTDAVTFASSRRLSNSSMRGEKKLAIDSAAVDGALPLTAGA